MSQLSTDLREEAAALAREGSPDTAALLNQAADELDTLEARIAAMRQTLLLDQS